MFEINDTEARKLKAWRDQHTFDHHWEYTNAHGALIKQGLGEYKYSFNKDIGTCHCNLCNASFSFHIGVDSNL